MQKKGHSRIPVYRHTDKSEVIGMLFVKDLIFVDPKDNCPVSSIMKPYKLEVSV